MDMIERVARAMCAANGTIWGGPRGEDDPDFLLTKIYHMNMARAAIEAMRDPTPKMIGAAGKALSPGRRPTEAWVSVNAKHGIRYRAMIDEALSRPTPEHKEE